MDHSNVDVLVVDNVDGGNSQTAEVAAKWNARYLIEATPGLSRARNAGAHASTGDFIAYVDDDCIVDSRWLTALAAEFMDPSVVAVTGQVSLPPSKSALGYANQLGERAIRFHRSHPLWMEMAHFGGVGIGCNMAIRRSAFSFWHGFDERLGRGCIIDGGEENLAFAELIDAGYVVCYTPDAVVFHSTRELDGSHQSRYLLDLRNAMAYATLLLVEKQGKRRIAIYIIEAFFGRRRRWRSNNAAKAILPPLWRRFIALASGPMLYLKSKRPVPPLPFGARPSRIP